MLRGKRECAKKVGCKTKCLREKIVSKTNHKNPPLLTFSSATTMAPKILAPLPPSMQMHLHPNYAVALGVPGMPKPKRSLSVIRAEKDERDKQKRMKEADQLTKVKNLAVLEDCMQEEERSADLHTNNPPITELKKALPKMTSAKIGLTSSEAKQIADKCTN
jgi:hypothetical protein